MAVGNSLIKITCTIWVVDNHHHYKYLESELCLVYFDRIVVDYFAKSLWKDHRRLWVAREGGCSDRHKPDP